MFITNGVLRGARGYVNSHVFLRLFTLVDPGARLQPARPKNGHQWDLVGIPIAWTIGALLGFGYFSVRPLETALHYSNHQK